MADGRDPRPATITTPAELEDALDRAYQSRDDWKQEAESWRLRWNKAMTDAGFAGSEYIDEPERIAREIKDIKHKLFEARKEIVKLRRELRDG